MKLDTFFRREGTKVMIGSEVVDGPTITDLTFGAIDAAICTAQAWQRISTLNVKRCTDDSGKV